MGLAACSSSTKTGKSIYTAAKVKTFDGVSGKVAFNKDGSRSATTSRIELYNIRFDLKGVQNTRSIKLVKTIFFFSKWNVDQYRQQNILFKQ